MASAGDGKAMDMEWNEPLYVEGPGPKGRIGVLVLHGFGGSPRSLQELTERLEPVGYTVVLPLLAGHGSTPEAMEASRWTEWTADVEQAYQWVRARTDKVFVCGLSMGGTLGLWVAERHPDVAGLVTINTFIRHPLEKVMLLIGRFGVPRWVKAIGNDAMAEGVDEKAYARLPMRSTRELALLSRDVRAGLSRVTCPALVFSSVVDHVVPPANQKEIYRTLGSTDKTFVELRDCYHLATMDCGKEQVFTGVLEFIAAHA
jgi:carboxylesterase